MMLRLSSSLFDWDDYFGATSNRTQLGIAGISLPENFAIHDEFENALIEMTILRRDCINFIGDDGKRQQMWHTKYRSNHSISPLEVTIYD